MRTLALGVLGALALFSGGCAHTPLFTRYFDAGRYPDAVRVFESDSTLLRHPDALLRAARLYSDPSLGVADRARARVVLERLVTDFPKSAEARQGRILLPLLLQLEAVDRLNADLAARVAELGERAARTDTLAASSEAAEREVQALRRRIQRLEVDLEQARQELERLKAIDLRRRPDR